VNTPGSPSTLPRAERLRGKKTIDALFARGTMGVTRFVTARTLPNDLPHARAAVFTGKACGNAVARNRLRRRLRACEDRCSDAVDVVRVVPRDLPPRCALDLSITGETPASN